MWSQVKYFKSLQGSKEIARFICVLTLTLRLHTYRYLKMQTKLYKIISMTFLTCLQNKYIFKFSKHESLIGYIGLYYVKKNALCFLSPLQPEET